MEIIENAKRRCRAAIDQIDNLSGTLSSKISDSCKRTLIRYAKTELSFLSRFDSSTAPPSLSVNIGHLEAVLYILQQPFVNGVSRVCKRIPPTSCLGKRMGSSSEGIHVDIVSTVNGNPVWFIVSDRNPKYLSWNGSCRDKGLRERIERVLDAARSSSTTKPTSVIFFFSHGLDNSIHLKLKDEFGAFNFGMEFSDFDLHLAGEQEGEWIYILQRSFSKAVIIEVKVGFSSNATVALEYGGNDLGLSVGPFLRMEQELSKEFMDLNLGISFCSLISRMSSSSSSANNAESCEQDNLSLGADLTNLDTTALIAIVSGISNGSAQKLLAQPVNELISRYKSNFDFVVEQVTFELDTPIHAKLESVLSGKRWIVCSSVCSEFKELVSMCGGPNEKSRAHYLLNSIRIVEDSPSERMMNLPTTRKLAMKNKVTFGTGDNWGAPTLSANMAFVRAVAQTGMSLFTIEHKPRALIGD
ncbi:uncharacterized protein LOC124942603 [Impatiens glandulifera]|uniref:uncharacterized protein LOC124942603 n=1 Tax=Impatiens glandulifera TaxID=253017 RepID=UPI001FB05B28|nr:uncharacterized protein LOC124942603 [Impatiens glandulifera]